MPFFGPTPRMPFLSKIYPGYVPKLYEKDDKILRHNQGRIKAKHFSPGKSSETRIIKYHRSAKVAT